MKRAILLVYIFLVSCNGSTDEFVRNKEARDDAGEYLEASAGQTNIKNTITPSVETDPVYSQSTSEDCADDPAIWLHPADPAKSIIYGSNKNYGIHTYDLTGKQLQYFPLGQINNIDVRQGVSLNGNLVDVLAGSNRSTQSVDLFILNPDGMIDTTKIQKISINEIADPYGFCLGLFNNQLNIYVNDRTGQVIQLSLAETSESGFVVEDSRRFYLSTQIEGMVVDDHNQILYVGEEQNGIWKYDATVDGSKLGDMLQSSHVKNNSALRYDIEGLALLPPHYLVASSQGNFSYAIFDTRNDSYLTSFKIDSSETIDGAEETDGIEILASPLGANFPSGIFVAQDGFNTDSLGQAENQNFKIVALQKILKLIKD